MNSFVQRHAGSVIGTLNGWDRLRFRGTLRMLANVRGLESFLSYTGQLFKNFGKYVLERSRQVRAASLAVAESSGRPVEHLMGPSVNKEDRARSIVRRDGVKEGLIGVLTAVEPCWSYDVRSDRSKGLLELFHAYRKCQHLYHYMIHPIFGFMHAWVQTWLPFNIQLCINGREWLSRQMEAAGIGYRRVDNCFTWVSDLARAQTLLDQQVRFDWPKALGALAAKVNPALKSIVGDYRIDYYWSLDESEWSSDVLFHRPLDLERLYPALIRHGMESFGSREVMRFLGRSVERGITPRFKGQVISDIASKPSQYEGMRIKHRVNRNSVKMYNKAGSVLRVETTLNNMSDLQAPRRIRGKVIYKRMRKGVADIKRRSQVSQASNYRYLEALAAVGTPLPLKTVTEKLSRPVRWKGKQVRGLNLLGREDASLLEAVGRGEYLISGFRNRDLQSALLGPGTDDPIEKRRRSARITRQFRMLRAHGLIHKVPHTHRYLVSEKGRQVIAALHAAREADIQKLTQAA
jgi:hypothetical protein